jgi:hypothetical protein
MEPEYSDGELECDYPEDDDEICPDCGCDFRECECECVEAETEVNRDQESVD